MSLVRWENPSPGFVRTCKITLLDKAVTNGVTNPVMGVIRRLSSSFRIGDDGLLVFILPIPASRLISRFHSGRFKLTIYRTTSVVLTAFQLFQTGCSEYGLPNNDSTQPDAKNTVLGLC